MSDREPTDCEDRAEQPGKTRTWWHPLLARLLNRFTLIQFKGPTDALQRGDLAQLVGCALLWHGQQQVQQFRRFGEDFAMQHKDSEYLGEVEAELRTAVLEAIPPEERLRGLPPEERLRGVLFDELLLNLSEDQVAQLREALERRPGQKP